MEQWYLWATIYIEMELTKYPNGARALILEQARDMACKHIADNPVLVLSSVHMDILENYNLAIERS